MAPYCTVPVIRGLMGPLPVQYPPPLSRTLWGSPTQTWSGSHDPSALMFDVEAPAFESSRGRYPMLSFETIHIDCVYELCAGQRGKVGKINITVRTSCESESY